MAKLPSQRKLLYQTGSLSNDAYTLLTSGGVSGDLNLPKDLSILNRRGYASTTRKGVPLNYLCKVDFYLHDEDGQGPSTKLDVDLQATLKIDGCQNNWVMRNAAVKWHAAREQMFRDAGVAKGSRGAYSHEIRYNMDGNADTWLVPIDGNGDAFTGGEWEISQLAYEGDTEFELKLFGSGIDQEAAEFNGPVLNMAHAYLMSRINQPADTNPETTEGPALHSVLNAMLAGDSGASSAIQDDVIEEARTAQDGPPYEVLDISSSGDVDHDITEPVELGRAIAGFGNSYGSCIVEIPFGLARVRATVFDAADTNITPSGLMCVEVLDIYEMQG